MKQNGISKLTQCVHTGTFIDERTQGVNSPIYTSTAFGYLDADEQAYPRYFNIPNQKNVVEKMCALESAEDGLVLSSGMAAITSTLFALLKAGDHAIFQGDIYGGTYHMVKSELPKFGIEYTFVNSNNPVEFEKQLRPGTKIIYIETPSNPLLSITDIEAIAKLAQSRKIITVIDNTFATPINQNPISLGTDVVVHSGTKYLGGHSDICCGVVVASKELMSKIKHVAVNFGGSLNANTCYLLERSLKTLALRVQKQSQNALEIARFLQGQATIKKVYYPGLETHSGYDLAIKQMSGFGGMLSFEVNDIEPTAFLRKLQLIKPALSLGGVESTICAPAQSSHAKMGIQEREKLGITNDLLRLSVGIEDIKDLIADLKKAFS